MKRLGIFFFYEKNGVVDEFILYYLADLVKNLSELVVVCNGKLSEQGDAAFRQFTDRIIVRENKGLDVWAYKTALDDYGWERLSEFDEVVMTNSTLMGPVRPLREMFDAMAEQQDLDFWGLSIHHGAKTNPFKGKHLYRYLPVHIQSHFIVYRKRFIQSPELQAYWNEMPMIESYTDSVQRYEAVFTKQFEDRGFKWDVYVKTDDLKEFTDYPLLVCPVRLLRDKKCPLFKRRSFMHTLEAYLNDTAGEPVRELYEYLKEETDYPVDLIWKNMIRTMHPHEFTRNLGLTRVVPPTVQDPALARQICAERRIALAMHLYFMDMLDQSVAFAAKFPPQTDVFISTNDEKKKRQIEQAFAGQDLHSVTVLVVENRGRDVAAFLCDLAPHLRGYDYVCFMHDKKAIQTRPGSVGASFGYVCNENVCKNAAHVLNVLCEFERDPYLGILCPPYPTHGLYFMNMCSGGWGPNFENTKQLLKNLRLDVPISGEESPIAPFGSVFWFRPDALEPLFAHGWQHSEFPPEPLPQDGTISHAIERVYPFVAQAAGYYPAVVMSRDFAVLRADTMQAYAGGMIRPLARVFDCTTFWAASTAAVAFAAKRHLFGVYGPYANTRRRHARNWLRDRLPGPAYKGLIATKRAIFGPRHGPYED
ncbi:MAG TPA: rhamnan synthesis F family protein [Candidatus Gemmiger avistercoris]|uniref:Rhamnan synthesis F family protein n=1 Tax=Candidatus Gemmiger avistercoris TaxID=2838606 RepID=A0A9D2FIV1_9FIRM|nr:rhamnan synthesis F family protein [uncultured Subdoligranulum sp.]HIZ61352.1 rhamnan synthesis F family protein [Candidatus Gemmiger avistercoris]